MINIPYPAIQPAAPYAMAQLSVMAAPQRNSLAERNAASVLAAGPPRMPDPANILTQFAQGAQLADQLRQALAPAPPPPINVAVMPQSVPMPSMTTSGGATIGGGMMNFAGSNYSIPLTCSTELPPSLR